MKKLTVIFEQKTKLIFGISFTALLLLKVLFYEWFNFTKIYVRLRSAVLFWVFISIWLICFISMAAVIFFHIRRKKMDKILLCVILLFLPLTDAYESLRFLCLRPAMENVAVEMARKYQAEQWDVSTRTFYTELSFPDTLLAREPGIALFDDGGGIRVAFVQHHTSPLSRISIYVYQTEVPYAELSKDKDFDINPEWVISQKGIYPGWEQIVLESPLIIMARVMTT